MALSDLYFVHLSFNSPSNPKPTKYGPTGGLGGAFRKLSSMRNPCDLAVNNAWNLESLASLGGGGGVLGFGGCFRDRLLLPLVLLL